MFRFITSKSSDAICVFISFSTLLIDLLFIFFQIALEGSYVLIRNIEGLRRDLCEVVHKISLVVLKYTKMSP